MKATTMNKNRMSSVWFDRDGTPLSIKDIEPLLIDPNYKVVKQETLSNGLWISTVWTGFNYGYLLSGPPLIFETMVFSKEDPSCEDLDQARAAHKICLKLHIAYLEQAVSARKAKEKTMPLGATLFRHRRRTNQIERQLNKSIKELKVLSGEKTVTRRLVKIPKCKYHPGSICSIKTNVDSDSLGFIEIVDVKKEVLGQLTSKEAINDRASYSKEPRVPCAL